MVRAIRASQRQQAILASRRRIHCPTRGAISGITALPNAFRRCGREGSPRCASENRGLAYPLFKCLK
jgi:hypothetical protein